MGEQGKTPPIGKDGAQYMRQQKGHSLLLHIIFGVVLLWIPTIYFAVSKNHYFHL